MASEPAQTSKQPVSRRDQVRLWASVGGGVLVALFALLNLDKVKVNWILGTQRTPLIVVIAVSFLLGAAVGVLADRRRRRG